MQAAYIISAYKRPDLLFRLVDALGDAPVSIHVDRKSGIWADVQARAKAYTNVTLLRRHVCYWGLFGHVRASIEGLKWFIGTQADYTILLTGQCYPIQPAAAIGAALDALDGRSVIEITAFPKPEWMQWENGGYSRVDRFWLKDPRQFRPRAFKPWTRRLPYKLHPYGGGGYWCLSRQAVLYVVNYIAAHPKFTQYFTTVFCPDEIFFQTILGNSALRDTLEDRMIHYTDWSAGEPSPAVLRANDLPAAFASGAWFARKFEDQETLDAIDATALKV